MNPRPRRENDARRKRIRATLRREARPCHLCGGDIDYQAHHLDPLSFQVDHLWQVANGGPEHDPDNVASAHRACNRLRSDRIDAIAIATAARYGVTLKPDNPRTPTNTPRCPQGVPCPRCNGTHNPRPGVSFITNRKWW
ncbi:HNH endonuclease [Mycolicibacterium elephantis]|uniref:HNH endonuclease n=1 Tax=Mycolicibacterium elephantis DSM 44368 TaxID=1335622 RepID=A0A439DPD0_9MYCO|nr:HNH endonuclease [Mycolicibacterium elephantis]MCV7219846.1 HNH endonuclease [Mycolicibacterium elephantis]RWA17430.1 HNH endonuclease [Mycolicibacterium elephantis DSM 44368]